MKRILIIEDNEVVRENTAEILELAGYGVLTASNGKEGVAAAKEHQFDLILCDIMMPELDGYGVLHILRDHASTATTPFIFLTAKAEQKDFRVGMDMGAEDYITKPFEDRDLLSAIEMRLKKQARLQSQLQSPASAQSNFQQLLDDPQNHMHYDAQDLIYREGQNARSFYFVINGKVKLSKATARARDFVVNFCGPGSFFGHTAAMHGEQYFDRAEAMEACELVRISMEQLKPALNASNDLNQALLQQLFQQALSQDSRLIQTAFGNLRERVAYQLLILHDEGKEGDQAGIQLSREELAAYIGIATESLIRTLSDFKSEGLISIEGKTIKLLDIKALKSLSKAST